MFGRRRLHSSLPYYDLSERGLLFSDAGATATAGGGSTVPNGANGAGSANGSAGNGTATTTDPQVPVWHGFTESIDRFTQDLGARFDALRQDVGQLPDRLRPEPPPAAAPDYEAMSNTELATHITGSLVRALETKFSEMLKPVVEQVQQTQQSHFRTTIESERDKLASTHKDFGDWKPEMIDLAKQHPTLGLAQLYKLARADNAAKAQQLDTKYNPPAPPPPPKWGGLTPAFGTANAGTPKLSRDDASKEAFREVSARHPGVLAALESM